MFFYVVLCVVLFAPFVFIVGAKNISWGVVAPPYIVAVFLVFFRGIVGTDTSAYLNLASHISDSRSLVEILATSIFEPGFVSIIFFLSRFIESNLIVINTLAAIVVVIFMLVQFRLPVQSRFAFGVIFVSHYLIPYSMNTVRVGLALSIASLGLLFYRENRVLMSAILFCFALSIQLSVAFVVALFLLLENGLRLRVLILGVLIGAVSLFAFYELLVLKMQFYSTYDRPDVLSGLSVVFLHLIILISVYMLSNKSVFYKQLIVFMITLILYIMAAWSYAFLRFLDLSLFVALFSVALGVPPTLSRDKLVHSRVLMVAAGFCSLVIWLRSVSLEDPLSGSMWVPYHTFFSY